MNATADTVVSARGLRKQCDRDGQGGQHHRTLSRLTLRGNERPHGRQ